MQIRRFRSQLAFGACGLMVMSAAVAYFAGDHKAAALIAAQALMASCLTGAAALAARVR